MEALTKEQASVAIVGLLALKYIGIGLCVIGAIILIICIVKKKSVVVPIIICILGVAAIFCSSYYSGEVFDQYLSAVNTLANTTAEQKAQYAKKDENGNIYYEIGSFSNTDNHGNTFSNDTLKEYKYTIVNLWEPWCVHCKAEMPDLEKIYEEYKDKGVNMVGFYKEEEDAQDVIDEYQLTYPQVLLTEDEYKELLTQFQMTGIPVTFVLDSNGKLVNLGLDPGEPYSQYEPEISEMYKCLVSGERSYDFWKEKLDGLLAG